MKSFSSLRLLLFLSGEDDDGEKFPWMKIDVLKSVRELSNKRLKKCLDLKVLSSMAMRVILFDH
jgi:hypothetical protein